MGIKTVTNSCDLQTSCPRKEGGVSFRPVHTKTESLKLKDAALPLRNLITLDNKRPGKRDKSGSTGLSPDNKNTNPQKTSGQRMVNALSLPLKIFYH